MREQLLIDSVTRLITGVVDWECVSLQPLWKAQRPPKLLYGLVHQCGILRVEFRELDLRHATTGSGRELG